MSIAPGIHRLPMSAYVADPCPEPSLSASVAHLLCTRSPRHVWEVNKRLNPGAVPWSPSSDMLIGSAVHAILLEGDESGIAVMEHEAYRSDAAKEARDVAFAAGQIPLKPKEHGRVLRMAAMAKLAIQACPDFPGGLEAGDAEQTLLWQELGTWCRCRPDWISKDRRVIASLKTGGVSANPSGYARHIMQEGYDIQAIQELGGLRALGMDADTKYIWIVQENEPPYCVSFVGAGNSMLELANAKRDYAMQLWRDCLTSGKWPGYPSRVAWAEAPTWAIEQWESRVFGGGDDE